MGRFDFLTCTDTEKEQAENTLFRCEKDHGVTFTTLTEDLAEAELIVEEKHLNVYNMVWGGFLFTLMDITAGIANICGGGFGPTVSGNIDYISSTKGAKRLLCRGKVCKHGWTFSYVDTEVFGENEKLLAKGSFIYYNLKAGQEAHP